MSILKVLIQDEPCNWHIQRKIYEQGWKFPIVFCFVCSHSVPSEPHLGRGILLIEGHKPAKNRIPLFHFMQKAFWRKTTSVEPRAPDTQKAIEIK